MENLNGSINESLTNRAINGLSWVSFGGIIQGLLNIIVLIVLARFLNPEEFGVLAGALVVVGFSQIFSTLGIAPAIVQRPDLSRDHIHVGFTLSVIMSCVVSVVVLLSAAAVALFFRMPELKSIVAILALVFPITGLSIVGDALLQREMQFKKQVAIRIISYAVGYGLVGIFFAMAGFGVWALVYAQLGQASINTLILLIVKREAVGISMKTKELHQLLNYGLGFSLARTANYSASQADILVIGRFLGADVLGIYGRAYQLLMMPVSMFGTIVDRVFFPAMASVQGDKVRLELAYRKSVSTITMLTMPLSGLLIILAPEIILMILGPKWEAASVPFQILASILVFRTSYKMSDSLARATGAVYRRAWRQGVYAIAIFLGAWIGQFYGITGVAIGVAIAIIINFLLMLQLSLELVNGSWVGMLRMHLRYLFITVVVAISALILKIALLSYHVTNAYLITGSCCLLASLIIMTLWVVHRGIFGEEGPWVISIMNNYYNSIACRSRNV